MNETYDNNVRYMSRVWQQGYNARMSMGTRAQNPYLQDTDERQWWASGYMQADVDEFHAFYRRALWKAAAVVAAVVFVLYYTGAYR